MEKASLGKNETKTRRGQKTPEIGFFISFHQFLTECSLSEFTWVLAYFLLSGERRTETHTRTRTETDREREMRRKTDSRDLTDEKRSEKRHVNFVQTAHPLAR